MSWWLEEHAIAVVAAGVVVVNGLAWWLGRCRHPNPHYVQAVSARDPLTGMQVTRQPARYTCYECGRSWVATQRDPAWTPTHVIQKFSGYDEEARPAGHARRRPTSAPRGGRRERGRLQRAEAA